jgi:hypothetical protein
LRQWVGNPPHISRGQDQGRNTRRESTQNLILFHLRDFRFRVIVSITVHIPKIFFFKTCT